MHPPTATHRFNMRVGRANGEEWLRLGEAAAALGVSLNTVRRWSDSGKLICYRSPGGHRRFRRGDVDSLLTTQNGGSDRQAAEALSGSASSRSGDPDSLGAPLLALARAAAEGIGAPTCRISLVKGDGRVSTLIARAAARTMGPPMRRPRSPKSLRTGRRLSSPTWRRPDLLGRGEAAAHLANGDAAILALPLTVAGRCHGASGARRFACAALVQRRRCRVRRVHGETGSPVDRRRGQEAPTSRPSSVLSRCLSARPPRPR